MRKHLGASVIGKDSNFRELILKGGTTFFLKILSLALGYVLMLLITKSFGADVFGRYSIAITFSQLAVMVFTLGLPTYIVKLTSDIKYFDDHPKSNYFKKSFVAIVAIGAGISASIYVLSEFLAITFFNDQKLTIYFKIVGLFVLPLMLHELLSNFFRGKKDFLKYNLFTLIFPYLAFFLFFYLIRGFFMQEEEVTFLSYMLGIAVIFLVEIGIYLGFNYRKSIDFPTAKLLKFAAPMMFSTAFLFLINWTDIFMLGALETSRNVGIYNVAFKIASIGYLVIIAINVVIAPKISELYSTKQFKPLKSIIQQSTRLITMLTLPLIGVIIFFRIEILQFFGTDFVQGETALIIIIMGILFNAMSGNVDQILNMTNHQKILRNITIISFLLNIVLNYLLIPEYGINGAALASLVTNVVLNGICIYFIKKKLGFYTFA